MGQVAVYSGAERRRRWSDEDRLRILGDAFTPGAFVTQVARWHDVSTALIYTWRRKLCSASEPALQEALHPGFAEAVVIEGAAMGPSGAAAAIIIDLARGRRVAA